MYTEESYIDLHLPSSLSKGEVSLCFVHRHFHKKQHFSSRMFELEMACFFFSVNKNQSRISHQMIKLPALLCDYHNMLVEINSFEFLQ